jgi:acetate kinase
MQKIASALSSTHAISDASDLLGIGHRVVHGGEAFKEPTQIDEQVLATIREQIPLAPLHNPANISGIEVATSEFSGVPQVAVFDTAFHQSIPRHAYHYAIPRQLYTEHRVRRYGFHGTSHRYVAAQTARYLGQPLEKTNVIVLHLGNGASATAVRDGKSVDTSMGMTPLEGLIMGTRCGDIDPALVFHLVRVTGRSNDELESILNKDSGLKGICGQSDMREVVELAESGDDLAQLAIEMVAYRLKKYIGAYYAVLGRVDAIVFTAGIGENNPALREQTCRDLTSLGFAVDPEKNVVRGGGAREIQTDDSRVKILVIPTNEELQIALDTVDCIQAG